MAVASSAARNGLPGDAQAVNQASQVAQFLIAHGITPVYGGNRAWTVASPSASTGTPFFWITTTTWWLAANDIDQPVVIPGGTTAIGRVEAAVQVIGSGADLQVTLYPDNGSGSPNTASPIASTTIPASHISSLGATGSLASAGPLATSRSNGSFLESTASTAWTQPAVTSGGAGNFASPLTSGNWTLFVGGTDNSGSTAIAVVTGVQYLGSGAVSGAIPQPSLPQAATTLAAAATPDTVIAAGGFSGSTYYANVWSASWDPSTGALGAWSAQQSMPAVRAGHGMAASGENVYVAGGVSGPLASNATSTFWWATVSNGQVTSWTAGPSLPQALTAPYLAAVNGWLILAGGQNASGTTQSATWYSQLGSGGAPGPWQPGPSLPQGVYAQIPGWNMLVTDSAVIIVSGPVAPATASTVTQSLAVSPDGPAPEWQLQNLSLAAGYGQYQCSAYPAGIAGQWEAVGFGLTSYTTATVDPVPMISVPLPATGLTPGSTYHLVFHQAGGDELNNYLLLGELGAATPPAPWLYSPKGSGGPWTAHSNRAVLVNVYDQAPAGPVLHLWQDSGARITSLTYGAASGQLTGVLEGTAFPSGSPEATLPSVVQVTWNGTVPAGTVQLA